MRLLDKKMAYLPFAALILSGSSLFAAPSVSAVGPPAVQSETTQDSAQASQLLEEVRSIASDLSRDAATLESYKLKRLSWESHAYQLTLAKQHINAIGARLDDLQAIRSTAVPWQQQAIDAIVPVAVQLASRTEDAINHLNENPLHLFTPVYTDHLSAIAANADKMKQSVDVFLDLASTQDKLDNLHERVAATES
ncbi:MAG TPA: hypothetical protein VH601_00720 [Bryobacteraceae bacterium]